MNFAINLAQNNEVMEKELWKSENPYGYGPFFFFSPSMEKIPPKEILGGKGRGLCDMSSLHIPVPPGFVIPLFFYQEDKPLESLMRLQGPLKEAMKHLELLTSCRFLHAGDMPPKDHPLFLSLRSGGAVSMPGMMDTFLNIGLSPENEDYFAQRLNKSHELTEEISSLKENVYALYENLKKNAQIIGFTPEFFASLHRDESINCQEAHHHPLYLLSCGILAVWQSAHKKRAKDYLSLSGKSLNVSEAFHFKTQDKSSVENNKKNNQYPWREDPAETFSLHETFMASETLESSLLPFSLPHEKNSNLTNCLQILQENQGHLPSKNSENFSVTSDCDEFVSWHQPFNQWSCFYEKNPSFFQSAVVIQAMVFSNGEGTSSNHQEDFQGNFPPYIFKGFPCGEGLYGSGVLFTRNPTTGEDMLFGEFLPHSQGDSLVSGDKTPIELHEWLQNHPKILSFFQEVKSLVEKYYKFPQDMEFSIENGYLFFLQTRGAKMSLNALARVLESLVIQGDLTLEDAYEQLSLGDFNTVDVSFLENAKDLRILAKGQDLGPGAVEGPLLWDIHNAESLSQISLKEAIVFVPSIHPDAIPALLQAKGVFCAQGGITSHGALILRSMGKVCALNIPALIQSCQDADNNTQQVLSIGGKIFSQGDPIVLENGIVYEGEAKISHYGGVEPSLDFFIKKAAKMRNSHIFVNGDSPQDIEKAILHGARGVGLVRSEHMMLFPHVLPLFRHVILGLHGNQDMSQERAALIDLHSQDIAKILKAAQNLPVTFRLLDPPLHEFFPKGEQEQQQLAQDLGMAYDEIKILLEDLEEYNPMMALRGVRLALSYPAIYQDQCLALKKAVEISGYSGQLKVMIPFVNHPLEMIRLKALVPDLKSFSLGIMIETPRACLVSWVLVAGLDFVSFGTNDLTQGTWCLSRDDHSSMEQYWKAIEQSINPFHTFDRRGTGSLMAIACAQLRQYFPHISLSVCGDHAGQWEQRQFFESLGITILSCSPGRILPMALGLNK